MENFWRDLEEEEHVPVQLSSRFKIKKNKLKKESYFTKLKTSDRSKLVTILRSCVYTAMVS